MKGIYGLNGDNENLEREFYTVRMSKGGLIVSGIILFLLLTLGTTRSIHDWLEFSRASIILAFNIFTFVYWTLLCLVWRIRVLPPILVVRNIFGIERTYLIDDITKIEIKYTVSKIYVGERRIVTIPFTYVHSNTLLDTLEKSLQGEKMEERSREKE